VRSPYPGRPKTTYILAR